MGKTMVHAKAQRRGTDQSSDFLFRAFAPSREIILLILGFLMPMFCLAATPAKSEKPATPSGGKIYEEVLGLLREHYVDTSKLTDQKLDQAAAEGIIQSLGPSAQLIDKLSMVQTTTFSKLASLNSVTALDPSIGYMRLEKVDHTSAESVKTELKKLLGEKQVTGIILDLRFSQGKNFDLIPSIAANFISTSKPIFSVKRGSKSQSYSLPQSTPTEVPLMVLVNHETREAAEVLAAVLKNNKRSVTLGNSPTAGIAFETINLKLSDGRVLRLATGMVTLPNENGFLSSLPPDITVAFNPETEKETFLKPFQAPEFKLEARSYSEAILTGREKAPPLKKKDEKKAEPASNKDMTLLHAIDLLKSIQTLRLSQKELPAENPIQ